VKARLKKGCFAGLGVLALGLLVALALGGMFLVQYLAEVPEEARLVQPVAGPRAGTVVLSLSSAAVSVVAGPAGEPIRVESSFDPDVYRLEDRYEDDGVGAWSYRLDFHERTVLHVSVVSIWLGKRSPQVRVVLPRDLPLALEARMRGGYLTLDLAGLTLTEATVELNRGVLGVRASEPLPVPLERLNVSARIGTMVLSELGNASPGKLRVRHGVGAALVDLGGAWCTDAEIDFEVALANGRLRLPDGVNIEGLAPGIPNRIAPPDAEVPAPTLRISTHFDMGDIRVEWGQQP